MGNNKLFIVAGILFLAVIVSIILLVTLDSGQEQTVVQAPAATPVTVHPTAAPPEVDEPLKSIRITVLDEQERPVSSVYYVICNTSEEIVSQGYLGKEALVFKAPDASYRFSLQLNQDHYFDFAPVPFSMDQGTDLYFHLQRKYKLNGFLFNSDHQSVANAAIRLATGEYQYETTSDRNGYFTLFPVYYDKYILQITHPDYSPRELITHPLPDPLRILLGKGDVLTLLTIDETQAPVGGVQVEAIFHPAKGGVEAKSKQTDIHGTAYFDTIQEGTCELTATPPFPASIVKAQYAIHRDTLNSVTMQITRKTFQLTGTVLEKTTEAAIPSVTVVCQSHLANQPSELRCMTDPEGKFHFENLVHGTYTLFAEQTKGYISGDFSSAADIGVIPPRQMAFLVDQDICDVKLYLKKSWQIIGKVIDENKNPLPGAAVKTTINYNLAFVRHKTAAVLDVCMTDEEGRFVIDGPFENTSPNATLGIRASHPDYEMKGVSLPFPQPATIQEDIIIQLNKRFNLRGQVTTARQVPIPGASIKILKDAKNELNGVNTVTGAQTDETGHYQAYIEPSGDLSGQAIATGFKKSEVKPLPSQDNGDITLNFELETETEPFLAGWVVDQDYEPVPEAEIYIRNYPSNFPGVSKEALEESYKKSNVIGMEITQTDEYGTFQIPANYNKQLQEDPLYQITARKTSKDQTLEAKVFGIEAGNTNIILVMESTTKNQVVIYGKAVHNREPVPEYQLLATTDSRFTMLTKDNLWKYIQSPDGSFCFKIEDAMAPPLFLVAYHPQLGLAYSEPILVEPNCVKTGVEIEFKRTIQIQGKLIDAVSKEPLAKAEVWFTKMLDHQKEADRYTGRRIRGPEGTTPPGLLEKSPSTFTDDQGDFKITLPCDQIWIHCKKGGYFPKSKLLNLIISPDMHTVEPIEMMSTKS
jgi:protocatechuate 3,4-dioxygenase beta subunit